MNCTYTPSPGQDINPYLERLMDIISKLNADKKKDVALQRIQLLIEDITTVLAEQK